MRPATTFQPASPALRRRFRCPSSTAASTSARANPSCRALSRAWSVQLTEPGSVGTAPQATDDLSHLRPGAPRFVHVATQSASAQRPPPRTPRHRLKQRRHQGLHAHVRVSCGSRLSHCLGPRGRCGDDSEGDGPQRAHHHRRYLHARPANEQAQVFTPSIQVVPTSGTHGLLRLGPAHLNRPETN